MPQPTGNGARDGPAPAVLAVPVRRRWLFVPLAGGLLLAVVSALLQMAKDRGFDPPSLQLDRLLNVDEDLSVMNWLTASTFLLAALVAEAVGAGQGEGRRTWLAAAAVLTLVSLDEAAGVHDPVSSRARSSCGPAACGRPRWSSPPLSSPP